MAQLMPLPLTVSCFSKIQIDFTFLVPAHLGRPGKRAVKRACVYFVLNESEGGCREAVTFLMCVKLYSRYPGFKKSVFFPKTQPGNFYWVMGFIVFVRGFCV